MAGTVSVGDVPFHYSPGNDDEPAITVIEAVAWASGVRTEELGPLQQTIDMDALNELFHDHSIGPDSEASEFELSFRFEGWLVTVEPGQVWVHQD